MLVNGWGIFQRIVCHTLAYRTLINHPVKYSKRVSYLFYVKRFSNCYNDPTVGPKFYDMRILVLVLEFVSVISIIVILAVAEAVFQRLQMQSDIWNLRPTQRSG